MLRQALSLADRGFKKEARKRYQDVIDKYPDTPAAAKARKLLEMPE
jgi:TolA-binding protein